MTDEEIALKAAALVDETCCRIGLGFDEHGCGRIIFAAISKAKYGPEGPVRLWLKRKPFTGEEK